MKERYYRYTTRAERTRSLLMGFAQIYAGTSIIFSENSIDNPWLAALGYALTARGGWNIIRRSRFRKV